MAWKKFPFQPDAASSMISEFIELYRKGQKAISEIPLFEGSHSMGQGAGGDITTYFDKKLEELIIDYCQQHGNVRLISEEVGVLDFGEPQWQLVADPLDGSKNAVLGLPVFSMSLAAMPLGGTIGEVAVGFVGDLTHDDYFYAVSGRGAYKSGIKIGTAPKKFSTVRSQIGPIGLELSPMPVRAFTRSIPVIERTETVRVLGSIALDMCYVASGTFAAVLDLRGLLRRLDILAGKLIIEESGGCVRSPDGSSLDDEVFTLNSHGDIVAVSSPQVLNNILELISQN